MMKMNGGKGEDHQGSDQYKISIRNYDEHDYVVDNVGYSHEDCIDDCNGQDNLYYCCANN